MKFPPMPLPVPDPPPPLLKLKAFKQTPIDPADACLPDGYDFVKVKSGKVVLPMDRSHKLRKPMETWWESTWVDGKVVPIYGFWDGRRGAKYVKPDGFDERKLCGALDKRTQDWCQYPLGACPLHCGKWAMVPGRACTNQKEKGKDVCRVHGARKRMGINSPNTKSFDAKSLIDKPFMRTMRDAIHEELVRRNLGTSLEMQLDVVRTIFVDTLNRAVRSGDTDSTFAALKKAWNDFVGAKGADDVEKAMQRIGRLIQRGVDISNRYKDVLKVSNELAGLVKVVAGVDAAAQESVNRNQIMTFMSAIITVLTTNLASQQPLLAKIVAEVAELNNVTSHQLLTVARK